MADIFLSYSRQDKDLMQRLRGDLLAAGFTVWTDEAELEPGTSSWKRAVEQAISEARCVVVILSPTAKQSRWVENELSYAEVFDLKVFPLLAGGDAKSAVPFGLHTTQRIDIRDEYQRVQTQLVPALRHFLAKEGATSRPEAPVTPSPKPPSPKMKMPGAYDKAWLDQQLHDLLKSEKAPPPKLNTPIAFDWVTIPAGEFLMGSDKQKDPQAQNDELPQHKLYLPEYHISRVPVTNAQYQVFVEATKYQVPYHWKEGRIPKDKKQHPVVFVSWRDAIAFCHWAGVRLPTEAEWEKAARGVDGRLYPWGNNKPDKSHCNFGDNVKHTTAVDTYPLGASPYGVLDMAGNVWEWTGSLLTLYPYQAKDGREDPKAAGDRVLRGGSFTYNVSNVRCAARHYRNPYLRFYVVGLRVVSPNF